MENTNFNVENRDSSEYQKFDDENKKKLFAKNIVCVVLVQAQVELVEP
jgi:hypothetical protein